MLKNDFELLQIKHENQEKTIDTLKSEIKDLSLEYANEIERTKKELVITIDIMNIYKGDFYLKLLKKYVGIPT